jgi:hypothetical protein
VCWLASYRRPARVFVRAATAEHHLAVAFACLWWRRFYHQWLVQASRPSGRRGQLPSLSRLVASAAAATAATNSAEGAVGLTTRVAVAFDRPVRGGGGAAAAGGAWAPLALAVAAVAPSPLAGGGGAEEGAEVALEAAGWKPQGSVVAGGFASVWQCTVTLPPGTTRLALMSGAEGALLSDQRGSACTVASVLGRWSEGPVAAEEAEAEAHSRTVLEGQIQMLGELLEVEPSAKWGLFTQTKLLLELQSAAAAAAASPLSAAAAAPAPAPAPEPAHEAAAAARSQRLASLADERQGRGQRILDNFAQLAELDPSHQFLYKDLRSAHALELAGSAAQFRWSSAAALAPRPGGGVTCAVDAPVEQLGGAVAATQPLSGVALTRLGRLEGLLPLRVLDLSHNALRELLSDGGGDFACLVSAPHTSRAALDGPQRPKGVGKGVGRGVGERRWKRCWAGRGDPVRGGRCTAGDARGAQPGAQRAGEPARDELASGAAPILRRAQSDRAHRPCARPPPSLPHPSATHALAAG